MEYIAEFPCIHKHHSFYRVFEIFSILNRIFAARASSATVVLWDRQPSEIKIRNII